jgi:galactose mutarotase-like enzyme
MSAGGDSAALLTTLSNSKISATIRAQGAELVSLRDAAGREFLWQAGPAWPRHAPVLFPIVGRLAGDALRHAGRSHPMRQHGIARDRRFDWAIQGKTECRLILVDDAETRAAYPFPFRLELDYALHGTTLTQGFCVTNTGETLLPAACGAHPAFCWPLPGSSGGKHAHRLEFEQAEDAPVRRLRDGLLAPETEPSPVHRRTLALRESLFAADALILDRPASRHLRYTAPGAPVVEIAWQGFSELGLWSKPGADFLCIEPWHGFADPEGFDGEFFQKPGLMLIPPGESRRLVLRISLLPEDSLTRSR